MTEKRKPRPLEISMDNRVSTRNWLENGELKSDRDENVWTVKKAGTCRKKAVGTASTLMCNDRFTTVTILMDSRLS